MCRAGRLGWVAIVALGLLSGCESLRARPKEHASASFLDSGATPRITGSQAADMQVMAGHSQESIGKFDDARSSYLEALRKDPKRADAEVRLAILDDRKGDQAGADKHFARALKLQPKNAEILCDVGYSEYVRRRWADAEGHLKEALAVDPSHVRSHENLALVLGRKGDSPGALTEFARAGCDPSDARANLALVLALEGRVAEARKEYALALAAKPASTQAQEGLRATAMVLSGKAGERAIASNGKAAASSDRAIVRTSAP